MTDNETIKALECCGCVANVCDDCPISITLKNDCKCGEYLAKNALDLINRQKAEIEMVKAEKDNLIRTYRECQVEVLSEFVERLKEKTIKCGLPLLGLNTKDEIEEYINGIMLQVGETIGNLVKEMTGGE